MKAEREREREEMKQEELCDHSFLHMYNSE